MSGRIVTCKVRMSTMSMCRCFTTKHVSVLMREDTTTNQISPYLTHCPMKRSTRLPTKHLTKCPSLPNKRLLLETSIKYSSKWQRKWPSKHPSPWPSASGLASAPNTANPASTSPPTSPPAIANMAAASLATPVPVNYKGVLFPAFDDTNIVSAVVAFWTNVQVCGSNVFVVAFGRVFLLLLLLRSLLFLF